MPRPIAAALAVAVSLLPPLASSIELKSELVASGFTLPLSVKFDASNRAYVVQQGGLVRLVENGVVLGTPFLDLSTSTTGSGEQGLLDLAFRSGFDGTGEFFAHYTDLAGNTVLSRFQAAAGLGLRASEQVVLSTAQPFANHNGGWLDFGPDGYLYLALGDGGSGSDPFGHGQDLAGWLGSILRLDVSTHPYALPPDNPFNTPADLALGRAPEIWAYGLRNPWRASFDGSRLYIGDVGQGSFEEVSVEDVGEGGGVNYGWDILEGNACHPSGPCDPTGTRPPVHVYSHADGNCSVTGGYVYRGAAIPQLTGHYFFGDVCTASIRSFRLSGGMAVDLTTWTALNPGKTVYDTVVSFGRDRDGELYVVDLAKGMLGRIAVSAATEPFSARAFPNPYRPGDGHARITFSELPARVEIRIYTLSGALLRTLSKDSPSPNLNWEPVANDAGDPVASGLYLFSVKDLDTGRKREGKLVVIR